MARHLKPEKPYAGFPLLAHDRGHWANKIRGKTVYFSRWDGPDGPQAEAALNRYHEYINAEPRSETTEAHVPEHPAYLVSREPRLGPEYPAIASYQIQRAPTKPL
ncbi:hypothetical protein [Rhodopirellula sp. P2]|uniref:hypothetical protein n=1 Tax=Rhodopirellula sp. P2 TaxID=2127060 RepID=UPI002368BB3A|nr:hypothetical protein [Rhodopirellula sp. P2]WDQ14969.1 hypothetical protein PSR62_15125 [Rhodopirellula sp. P2]